MKLTNRNSALTAQVTLSSVAVLVTLLASPTAIAAESIYKTISEDGSVVFTDTPKGSSAVIAPTELNVVDTPTPTSSFQSTASNSRLELEEEAAEPQPLSVNAVKITSPAHEQTIINPRGSILVGIETGPENGMPEGHTSEIKMDGQVVSKSEGTLLAIPAPDRGKHILQAVVLNADGIVQASSEPVTIHVMKSFVRSEE